MVGEVYAVIVEASVGGPVCELTMIILLMMIERVKNRSREEQFA